MSDNDIIIGLASIVLFGVGAQWVARRRGFPSLLLLLPFGLLAGPVLGLVEPEKLFGDSLFPGVTLLVALLLFQSGLQLRISELPRHARRPVVRLVSVGALVTFLGGSLAVWLVLRPPLMLSCLLAAVLVVSGPTVVGPLLTVVRPREPTGAILSWESTTLDPIGATLAVVVLNLVLASRGHGIHPVLQMLARLGLGVGVGALAAALLILVMSRFLVTDNMEAAVALLFAVAAFATAEVLLSEAGLFATVTLGIIAANQRVVPTSRITGFGETLEVLIIGALFIVLGALVDIHDLLNMIWRIALLVVVLVLLVRPLSVVASMFGSKLAHRDRALIAWIDPRGIVAASVAASFAGSLAGAGFDSDFLLPAAFGVILGTGVIYGLSAPVVAERLGVRLAPRRGVCLVGNELWLGDLGLCLSELGVPVLVGTADPDVTVEDRSGGVLTVSLYDDESRLRAKLEEMGIAQAIVALPAGVADNLVTALLVESLGRRNVYRLERSEESAVERSIEFAATARALGPDVGDAEVNALTGAGASVEILDPDVPFDPAAALMLAAVSPAGGTNLAPLANPPGSQDRIIGLIRR